MENRDYREEIGKKLEEALELGDFSEIEDLIEMPSPETFAKWTELGVEKHNKRVRRKRTLAACAIFVVVCVSALIAIKCIAPPEVEAGPDGKIGIDNSMDRTTTYETWADLPNDMQEKFIEVKNLPAGYVVEEIVLAESRIATKVEIKVKGNQDSFVIRQYISGEGTLSNAVVANNNSIVMIHGKSVYIEENKSVESITYKYVTKNIAVDIITTSKCNENIIRDTIKLL